MGIKKPFPSKQAIDALRVKYGLVRHDDTVKLTMTNWYVCDACGWDKGSCICKSKKTDNA